MTHGEGCEWWLWWKLTKEIFFDVTCAVKMKEAKNE